MAAADNLRVELLAAEVSYHLIQEKQVNLRDITSNVEGLAQHVEPAIGQFGSLNADYSRSGHATT